MITIYYASVPEKKTVRELRNLPGKQPLNRLLKKNLTFFAVNAIRLSRGLRSVLRSRGHIITPSPIRMGLFLKLVVSKMLRGAAMPVRPQQSSPGLAAMPGGLVFAPCA